MTFYLIKLILGIKRRLIVEFVVILQSLCIITFPISYPLLLPLNCCQENEYYRPLSPPKRVHLNLMQTITFHKQRRRRWRLFLLNILQTTATTNQGRVPGRRSSSQPAGPIKLAVSYPIASPFRCSRCFKSNIYVAQNRISEVNGCKGATTRSTTFHTLPSSQSMTCHPPCTADAAYYNLHSQLVVVVQPRAFPVRSPDESLAPVFVVRTNQPLDSESSSPSPARHRDIDWDCGKHKLAQTKRSSSSRSRGLCVAPISWFSSSSSSPSRLCVPNVEPLMYSFSYCML